MSIANNLASGVRARRKQLITVAAWGTATQGVEANREILGIRTEDSSIEFNPDTATSTDILGNSYTDVNKLEPQQTFDPFYRIGGSALSDYLAEAALSNKLDDMQGVFTIYVIEAYMNDSAATPTQYRCYKETECTILPTSMGGDNYVSMPIEVHFSNKVTVGTVDKLTSDFTFSAASI